jgi:hypothetical protein
MQVNAVLVDELALEPSESSPVARAVLYSFEAPRLVSARRTETPLRVGPVGVLDGGGTPTVELYPPHLLSWDGRRRDSFPIRKPWTPPPWTLYVLFPPAEFFASTIRRMNRI